MFSYVDFGLLFLLVVAAYGVKNIPPGYTVVHPQPETQPQQLPPQQQLTPPLLLKQTGKGQQTQQQLLQPRPAQSPLLLQQQPQQGQRQHHQGPAQFATRPQRQPLPPHPQRQPDSLYNNLQGQVLQQPLPPQGQPLQSGVSPARPIHNPGTQASYGPFPSLLGLSEGVRRVDDTLVSCEKTHMTLTFRFSAPFSGYIYPHQHFAECLLFQGHNSREAVLTLRHGTCGDQESFLQHKGNSYLDPVIEHRLMVQWEKDIVCEDDSSVIVRCDRPDDFNKTVEWRLETRHLLASLEKSQHPGPRMWMEIQKGEGPTAPPLVNELVYIGDVLTLIFTLSDDTYWFDSNVIACFAVDGGEDKRVIEWDTSNNNQVSAQSRVFSGEATVIEQGCSVKPKVFGHFIKEKHTRKNGDLVTLHYAHFKAFRFPTSHKLIVQCNVQVCYKECLEPPPCNEAFHPRIVEDQKRRKRRQAEAVAETGAHEVDDVSMRRSIEVQLPEEGGAEVVQLALSEAKEEQDCYSGVVFITVVAVFVCIILVLLVIITAICLKGNLPRSSFFTPTKTQQ